MSTRSYDYVVVAVSTIGETESDGSTFETEVGKQDKVLVRGTVIINFLTLCSFGNIVFY